MLKGYGRIGAQIPDKGGRHEGAVMIEYKGYLGEFAFDDEAGSSTAKLWVPAILLPFRAFASKRFGPLSKIPSMNT
jgi:hypothetical protein